ncbi:MAG: PEP-CTERM sorting domain-containing protein [Planctomycetia bacterium]|nr:PEP-CTERM sorting domain-containing protein [Planctomycetia bacterium]
MRIMRRSFQSLLVAMLMSAPVGAWTVDEGTKIISIGENETVAYSDLSSYDNTYTINIAETGQLTHTEWVYNPMTGTGVFNSGLKGDFALAAISSDNLSNFSGTLKLPNDGIRFNINSLSENITVEISGASQYFVNRNIKSNLYLHDTTGRGYENLGLLRFDGNNYQVTGNVKTSGEVRIASRWDGHTSVNTISGAITGVHATDLEMKDNITFVGNVDATRVNTFTTIVLTNGNNSWNGTTTIEQLKVELSGEGKLGAGEIIIKEAVTKEDGTYTSEVGTLVINKTANFAMDNTFSGTGNIINKGNNITTLTGSMENFSGMLDAQAGTVVTSGAKKTMTMNIAAGSVIQDKYVMGQGRTDGGIKLTGEGRYQIAGVGIGGNFYMDAYDFSQFAGTLEIVEGRTFETRAKYFGENATVQVNDGASLMFYDGGITGDYKSDFILAGNGHSEKRGAVRFHQKLTATEQANLNTANNVDLANMAGDVTLAADTLIVGRYQDVTGWGVISGNISGNYKLTLNDVGEGWVLLTGTNTYGKTVIDNGTVQLGYVGSINGNAYDGMTGTLGTEAVTINQGGILDYRRVNTYAMTQNVQNDGTVLVSDGELQVTGAKFVNNGTVSVADGAVFSSDALINKGKFTGDGTVKMAYGGGPSNEVNADFSGFTGMLHFNAAGAGNNRLMFNNTTRDFGSAEKIVLGEYAQFYLTDGATIIGNLEFGTSVGFQADSGYQAALRSDGTNSSYVYGSVNLTDDGASISTRAGNGGNPENGSKLYLYADVTGAGSLNKQEDTNDNSGVLYIGTVERNGKTYGGTVDYAGKTSIGSGILILMDGVTMYAQDDIMLGNTGQKTTGNFVLSDGATLSIGAADATEGMELKINGTGAMTLGGTFEMDVFSATNYDTIDVDLSGVTLNAEDSLMFDIDVAEGVDLGDEYITLTNDWGTDFWANFDNFNITLGYSYLISATGALQIGSSSAIPEPGTWALLLLGGAGIFWLRRKA